MKAKFQIGDKVRFTNRVCKYIARDLRHRTRTIVDKHYDPIDQCIYYRLGIRGDHSCEQGFGFRSYMLYQAAEKEHILGRPREKRRYRHRPHPPLIKSNSNEHLGSAYERWRRELFRRDKHTCQVCGSQRRLEAHHINARSLHPELTFILANGVTLCEDCHNRTLNAKQQILLLTSSQNLGEYGSN